MTKGELRQLETHALVGRIVDLEHLRERASGERANKLDDELAAANAIHRMRLRMERIRNVSLPPGSRRG